MANPNWEELVGKFNYFKTEFDKSFKCISKSQKPTRNTINKHLQVLQTNYNNVVSLVNLFKHRLTKEHIKDCEKLIFSLNEKLQKVAEELELPLTSLTDNKEIKIPLLRPDSPYSLNTANSAITTNNTMADPLKFIESASKILPDFDGNYNMLGKFIDAITLLNSVRGENSESILINIINTKISSTVRNKIQGLLTVEAIITKLKTTIKGDSAETIIAKLKATKQSNREKTEYTKQIQQLANELANTYISDGMTEEAANKIATKAASKSIIDNVNSERVKIILEAGTYNSVEEVTSKFLEINYNEQSPIVYFTNRNRLQRHNNSNNNWNRSTNSNSYRRYHNNNNRNYRGNQRTYNRTNNYHSSTNNNSNNSHNNNNMPRNTYNNNRRINLINSNETENYLNPQPTHLGEN